MAMYPQQGLPMTFALYAENDSINMKLSLQFFIKTNRALFLKCQKEYEIKPM